MGFITNQNIPFINDYRINLLNPLEITDFSKFETGLRPLFELLKNASDEEKLNELITKDDTFTRVDVETVAAINLFVGTDIKYDEKEEVVNMCKAWDDHKKLGIHIFTTSSFSSYLISVLVSI